jgi:phage-related protein
VSNNIEIVVSSKDQTSSGFKSAEDGARKLGDGFDKAGERADDLDTKAMGFRDTLTGVQDTMLGTKQIAEGDLAGGLLTLGMGVGDLASGFANLLIPLGKTAVIKGFAAAQWLVNAALSANPIGLVVLAIAGLIAIFIIAWKKSDTFREIVTKAFSAVWEFVKKVGAWFKDTLWPWLRDTFNNIIAAVGKAKDWIVKRFTEAVDWLKGLPGKIRSAASKAWDSITSGATAARDWAKKKLDELVGNVKGIPKRISSAVSGMWDGIKSAFRSAINWVIGKWNNLSFSIPGVDTHIPGVGKIGGFSIGTPNIPYLASGGHITRGGLAVVGEKGAEVVDLPTGSTVYPHGSGPGGSIEEAAMILAQAVLSIVAENNRGIVRAVGARA